MKTSWFTSKTCTQKCLAALFITATNCKPTQMSFNKQAVKQAGQVPAMELLSGVRRKEPLTHTTQRHLQRIFAKATAQALQVMSFPDITYMTNLKRPLGLRRERGRGVRWRGGRARRGCRRAFAAVAVVWALVSVQAGTLACSARNFEFRHRVPLRCFFQWQWVYVLSK